MNLLELVNNQLTLERNLLEVELERVINDKDINTSEKVRQSKELLKQISETLTTINVTNGYLSTLSNKE
jgi:hypothetical protein